MNLSLVEWPTQHPGKCVNCGCGTRADGRKYVDMGIQVPIYGAIYICEHCIRQLGAFFGLIDKMIVDAAHEAKEQYLKTLEGVVEENGRLRRSLSELDFLGSFSAGPVPSSEDAEGNTDSDAGPVESDSESEQQSAGLSEGTDNGEPDTSGRPSESDSSEGPSGLSSDDVAAIRAERRAISI
jgi:hypothetical protein